MRRLRNGLLLVTFWLVVTPLLLEGLMRAAVPSLPPALRLAAERVQQGESLDINRIGLMTMDIDHNFMMRPNIEGALYGPHRTVIFAVDTVQILDSRMGFRTRPVQPGEQIDVAVVGDSFSFCFTAFEDCWVTRFEDAAGLRTMNLAQGSTGSMSHWRFIDTFGRAFEPPLVIWQFFVNDFNEDYQLAVTRGEMQPFDYGPRVPDYDDAAGPLLTWLRTQSVAWVVLETALIGEDAYISDFERFYFTRPHSVTYNGHTLRFGQLYEQVATDPDDPRNTSGVPMTTEALRLARETVEGWGGRLAVFLVPTREEVYAHLTAPVLGDAVIERLGWPRRELLTICADLGLTCYDLLPDLQAAAQRGEHLYYTEDMHLNPHGNAVVAELVRAWLDTLGWLLPAARG